MYTNVNLSAPIGALAFLGAGFLFFVAGVALVISIVKRRFALTRAAAVAMAAIAVMYLSLLLVFSFRSNDKLLARAARKNTFVRLIVTWRIRSSTFVKRKRWVRLRLTEYFA